MLFHLGNSFIGDGETKLFFCAGEIKPEFAPGRLARCGGEERTHFGGGIAGCEWGGVGVVTCWDIVHVVGKANISKIDDQISAILFSGRFREIWVVTMGDWGVGMEVGYACVYVY